MSAHTPYGQMLREARKTKRMTLEQVSKELGRSPSYVREVEVGGREPLQPAESARWALLVGLDPADVLDARARHHERSTLPLGLRPDQDAAALELGRRWAALSTEKVKAILKVVCL